MTIASPAADLTAILFADPGATSLCPETGTSAAGGSGAAPVPTPVPPPSSNPTGISNKYDSLFQQCASETGLPYQLLKALAASESGPQFDNLVSIGALSVGVMQVNIKAHPEYNSKRLLSDPQYNICAGATILKDLIKAKRGNVHAALLAYKGVPNDAYVFSGGQTAGEVISQIFGDMTAMGCPVSLVS